jgi:hypothetical protein
LQALLEQLVLLETQAHARVEVAEVGIDARQLRLVVLPPQADHVVERIEAHVPRGELAAQIFEVEVILERGLEIVRREQLHQVVRLGRLRQRPQTDDPVLVLPHFLAHEHLQELAVANARQRGVEPLDLVVERFERVGIEQRSAAVHVELAVRERQRELGLLHRRVRALALRQQRPRHDGALVVLAGHRSPTGREQRSVRERPFEPYAIERCFRAVELLVFDE